MRWQKIARNIHECKRAFLSFCTTCSTQFYDRCSLADPFICKLYSKLVLIERGADGNFFRKAEPNFEKMMAFAKLQRGRWKEKLIPALRPSSTAQHKAATRYIIGVPRWRRHLQMLLPPPQRQSLRHKTGNWHFSLNASSGGSMAAPVLYYVGTTRRTTFLYF